MPLIAETHPHDAVADLLRTREPFPARAHRPRAGAGVPPCAPAHTLAETIAARRSVRRFAHRPLDLDGLTRVLESAWHQQARQWPADRHGRPGLGILVAAHAVTGLPPGLYPYEPATGVSPTPVRRGSVDAIRRLYTPAPALVLICGPVRSTPGAAYGNLLVRAGALGYAIWLCAVATDLGCSVYGGASASLTRRLGPGRAHLFTVAVGHADSGER